VTRFFFGLASKYATGVSLDIEEVNGAPAIVARTGDAITSIVTFVFDGGRIVELNSVVNPDKLAFAQRQVAPSS
jgi:RNA polymerase sigma-70 factor (ECF subfamily)